MSGNPAPVLADHAFVRGMPPDYVERLADAAVEISVPDWPPRSSRRAGGPTGSGWSRPVMWRSTCTRSAGEPHRRNPGPAATCSASPGCPRPTNGSSAPWPSNRTTAFEFDATAVIALC